jgi:hypothetical protein
MPPPAATQAAARLWTQPTPSFPARHSYRSSFEITRTLWWKTRITRGRVREWKSGHNSVTVQNWAHVYVNFFDHKDLGNHVIQICPKVVKHPVYIYGIGQIWQHYDLRNSNFLTVSNERQDWSDIKENRWPESGKSDNLLMAVGYRALC